ncbi:MAG: DUF6503 family protein [Rubricoccaceae bacterium]
MPRLVPFPLALPALLALALGAPALGALAACRPDRPAGGADARRVVQQARAAHGVDALEGATLAFTFRETPFALRAGRRFAYTRTRTDSAGRRIEETVDRAGAHRRVEGRAVPLTPDEQTRLTVAIGSVAYFALLPAPLADPAVRVRSLGPDTLRGQPYARVEVRFAEDGGGADWQDRYVYWIHATRHTVDYLAYTYAVAPGADGPHDTGTRFREAFGARDVGGFRVQNYRNYTAPRGTPLEAHARLFEAGALAPVSEVRLEDARLVRGAAPPEPPPRR